jgi:hypothetical protein
MGMGDEKESDLQIKAVHIEKTSSKHFLPQDRLQSLDFFRGFTMLLLIAEFTSLFSHLVDPSLKGTFQLDGNPAGEDFNKPGNLAAVMVHLLLAV